jgi:GT2 family glycosyltransferase
MTTDLSIIIPALNENDSVEKMVSNIHNTIGLEEYEIIIVNSGGTKTSTIRDMPMVHIYNTPREGAPQARNFGESKVSSDFLLFADAHLEFKKGWGPSLLNGLEQYDKCMISPCITRIEDDNRRGCGYKWNSLDMDMLWLPDVNPNIHEIPFACGCCLAVGRKMFNDLGQFDSGIRLLGFEDTEISLRAWLMGYRMVCDPTIRVGHKFRKSFPYHIDIFDFVYNKIRFSLSHFAGTRLSKHLRKVLLEPEFNEALLLCIENETLDRRADLFASRIYDDDWFFNKFPMSEWC